jgi:hypothetical protein
MLTRAFDSKWKNWVMRLVREGGGGVPCFQDQ